MNLFGLLDISGSALSAERIRAEVIAVNMANTDTTRTASGGPYVRQQVVFASAQGNETFTGTNAVSGYAAPVFHHLLAQSGDAEGVRVAAVVPDPAEPIQRYDPEHPDADKNGFVSFPAINPLTEMVDLMGASRAYGLNSSAIQATKSMIASSLEILK